MAMYHHSTKMPVDQDQYIYYTQTNEIKGFSVATKHIKQQPGNHKLWLMGHITMRSHLSYAAQSGDMGGPSEAGDLNH